MTKSKLSSLIGIRSILKGSSLGIVVGGLSALICIIYCPFSTTGMTSNNQLEQITFQWLPFVFVVHDQGGSISPEGFLSSVLLWLVIIVAVVSVGVTVVVVIIVAVVVVVESWAKEFYQDRASSVKVPVANFTLQSSVQLLQENTDSVLSNQQMRPIAPSIPSKLIGTDKSKITRKQSKASKHGHENQKNTKPKPKALANFHLQGPILQFPKVIYNLKERKERQGPNVQTSQSSTVLTVEKGAGIPFTIHCLPRFHCHGKIKGQIEIKGYVSQFKEAQAQNQGQISLIKGILILVQAQRPRNQW
ncbi:hypothetical protein Tco_0630065 [Tanacetum coccineum]